MGTSRVARQVTAACVLAGLIAGALREARAQIAGGDIRFGTWNFLYGENERWPEVGGRLRIGRPGARTQLAVDGGVAFDFVFGGSWQALGAMVMHEPGVLGRRYWYVGAGYTALWASGGAPGGFAHGAQGLVGLHLGRGPQSRWSLEGRLLIGPGRTRDDATHEPVRYLSIGFARRFGATATWRADP